MPTSCNEKMCQRCVRATVLLLLACASAAPAQVVFTANTSIAAGNTTHDNQDIIVDGCTLTIDGHHPFHSLQLINGAVVTHPVNPDPPVYSLDLAIASDVTVAPGCRIDVSGRGCPARTGAGAGASTGGYGAGAGHAGLGGAALNYNAAGGGAYAVAALLEPTSHGSGGGGAGGAAGGGVIRLAVAGSLTVDGAILARGAAGSGTHGGGGAGGSIWLSAGTLAGAGAIAADGGHSGNVSYSGGGGGGRVAVYRAADTFSGIRSATGGDGWEGGGAGTIYVALNSGAPGTALVENGGLAGAWTALASPAAFDLTIAAGASAYADTPLTVRSLAINDGGRLTHLANAGSVHVTVQQNATVAAGGAISADARGYSAQGGPGAGQNPGGHGSGAGHGGVGGAGLNAPVGGLAYALADLLQPTVFGSGGANPSGGRGGGAIRLTVDGTLSVQGRLSANAGNGTDTYAGGGAGGSLWVTAGELAGDGVISANGGAGGSPSHAGGGGGGRIAIFYTSKTFSGQLTAIGGDGWQDGGAGTIYQEQNGAGLGEVLVDNAGVSAAWTPLVTPAPFNLRIGAGGIVYPTEPLELQDLVVESNGLFTHLAGEVTFAVTVNGDASILADGAIAADAKGHAAQSGPGAGQNPGGHASGAGHGGVGGAGVNAPTGGLAYALADLLQPIVLGSGGANPTGGRGGGALKLNVQGRLTVDGRISADGGDGAGTYAGGGSGGSLWISARELAGGGAISADGGRAGNVSYSGGGGGGRMAIYCDENTFAGSLTAIGGAGWQDGGAGTIYLADASLAPGELVVQNSASEGAWTPLASPAAFDLRIGAGAVAYPVEPLALHNLVLDGNGLLTQLPASGGFAISVAADATIGVAAAISVDGRGHPAQQGPGAGRNPSGYGSGAGYGGDGGVGQNAPAGLAYALATAAEPAALGSGGASGSGSTGGGGGGALRLIVEGTLTVAGQLSCNGQNGSGTYGGGGSGGSLWVTAGALAGDGVISADGGASGNVNYAGGGGGGRIALFYTDNTFAGALTAVGGAGWQAGGAGTIYLAPAAPAPVRLVIDNGSRRGAWTPLVTPSLFDVEIRSNGIAYPAEPLLVGAMLIGETGLLTHPSGDTGFDVAALDAITIASGGAIAASARGYAAGSGPGRGANTSGYAGGGGYGGRGGDSVNHYALGGAPYGAEALPLDLGSGGGNSSGGAGGGLLRLMVGGTLTVDGELAVRGGHGSSTHAGGGGGGSILVKAAALAGAGTIAADGGDAGNQGYSGGGGGGRIAILCCDIRMMSAQITALGGQGWQDGEAGTVFIGSGAIEILQAPQDVIAFVGESTTLTIGAATTQGVLRYQWRKDGEDLQNTARITGVTTNTLRITSLQLDDNGFYDVWLTDDCGAALSTAARLIVPQPGDLNCDGAIDNEDIDPFVLALTNPAAYGQVWPLCRAGLGDINGDGFVDNEDIDPFVALLTGP